MQTSEKINSKKKKNLSYLRALFNNRCPHCREGKLFVNDNAYILSKTSKMHSSCPVCGQPTEIEVGFYYGTSYVSYMLTVAISGFSFVAWWLLFGFSIYDNRIFYWLTVNSIVLILMQPLLIRLSRTLWLSWFVSYDSGWAGKEVKKYERVVKEQMNNW